MSSVSTATVHVLTQPEREALLMQLRRALEALPEILPENTLDFRGFTLSPEECEDRGRGGAMNHLLECTFCPGGRLDGPFLLQCRGPGLLALVDVLATFTCELPGDVVLQKWISDLIQAAEHTCKHYNVRPGGAILGKRGLSASSVEQAEKPPKKKATPSARPLKKHRTDETLEDCAKGSVLHLYEDVKKPPAKGPGGPKPDPILEKLIVYTKELATGRFRYRCIAANHGCTYSASTSDLTRTLKHGSACQFLDPPLRQEANQHLATRSLSHRVESSKESKQSQATDTQPPAAASTSQSSLHDLVKREGSKQLKLKLDLAIVRLICVAGIPPHVADLDEWKSAWQLVNNHYRPASRTTIEDSHIPAEAAVAQKRQIEILQHKQNLTISFDGGSMQSTQSNLTIHVSTEDRRVFFFEGVNSTGYAHRGSYYYHNLKQVIEKIAAREMVNHDYPWIIILPDSCHRLSRLCGDICRMEHYKEPISILRRTIKFMNKSGDAREQLKRKRLEMGISRGLVAIGKTRFASIYHSAASLKRCMPALRDLCVSKKITIKDVNVMYLSTSPAWRFAAELEELVAVLEPIAKSIKCLESTHSTVSDVYLFWLACTANTYDLITQDGVSIPEAVKSDIRSAMNARWKQMIEDAPHDVYHTGFVLDPRFRGHNLINDLNPLILKKIKITALRQKPDTAASRQAAGAADPPPPLPQSLRRAGNYLL
ncbi:hypothetical protein ACG7TL_001835 [Trametes sanguinea]